MKECNKCKELKSLSSFGKSPKCKDGYEGQCKLCRNAAAKSYRKKNFDKYSEYEKKRYQENYERKLKLIENAQKWREENPEAYKAQTAVNNAIRDMRLFKMPCTFCGSEKNLHAHHNDYKKPLEVIWLCAKCHHRAHAAFPQIHGHEEKGINLND